MSERTTVLVVDDDPALREYVARALLVDGHTVEVAPDAQTAQRLLERLEPAVLVADVFLKGINGLELLKWTRGRLPATQVVLIGRAIPTYTVVSAMKQGAFDFVEKPIDGDHLLLSVGKALEHHRLTQENAQLRRAYEGLQAHLLGGIVAASPGMQEVLGTVERVAPSDLTVLITGESGVGKELVANRIHQLSPRAQRPFVAINCGAIQETLLESELFGHVKGAFTGATQDRQGLFEVAQGGTLFLDEIGELNLDLQVKLLRVLERRELRRVGGTKLVHVDVRVVAATNKRLAEEARAGRFREDLFYRLNVVHVDVPPLRERTEDVSPLVESFLASHRRKDLPDRRISPEALDALRAYPWPGNVRELRNVIERALILSSQEEIGPADLPASVRRATGADVPPPRGDGAYDAGLPLAEVERRHILRVLAAHDGNKVRTARALGINVKTLYNKLRAWEALSAGRRSPGDA